ncbi:MAG: hypothetical protein JXR37_07160 [Kiritimatiellae bacterium]|nr:hypothetical protein [Kiritimatiellia bacterium]
MHTRSSATIPAGLVLSLVCGTTAFAAPAGGPAALRVLAVVPAQFDYVLTSVTARHAGNPILAFNHRSGRTCFVSPGERLDTYAVAAVHKSTRRVFKPSLNTHLDEDLYSVTLRGSDGVEIVLTQNEALPEPGYIAYLAHLASGAVWPAKAGDAVALGPESLQIETVSDTTVTVSLGPGVSTTLAAMTAQEKAAFDAARVPRRLNTQATAGTVTAQTAAGSTASAGSELHLDIAGRHEPSAAQPGVFTRRRVQYAGPGPGGASGGTRLFVGEEYRVPSEYGAALVPTVVSGRIVWRPVLIPTRFETYRSGVSIGTR